MYARDWQLDVGAGPGTGCAVLVLDREGRVVSWDGGAEGLLGVGAGELRGRECLSLLTRYEQASAKRDRALEVAAAEGHYETQGWKRRADGSRFWASLTVAPLLERPDLEAAFMATVRDVTEGKRRADELRLALEISRAILAGQPQGAVLQLVAQRARALVESDCALVRTPAAAGNVLILRAAAWRRERDAARASPAYEVPLRASIAGRVFTSGRPRLVVDRPAARTSSDYSELGLPGCRPALFVPLTARSRRLGTLMAQNWKSGRPFHRQDLELLLRFANRAALALDVAQVDHDRDRQVVTDERERLGRELHDGAMQSLYAVTLGLTDAVTRTWDHGLQEQLGSLAARIDGVVQGLRNQVHRLRRDLPPVPSDDPRTGEC